MSTPHENLLWAWVLQPLPSMLSHVWQPTCLLCGLLGCTPGALLTLLNLGTHSGGECVSVPCVAICGNGRYQAWAWVRLLEETLVQICSSGGRGTY